MTHLSPERMVDMLEGCPDARAAAHVASCETCRARIESLRLAVRLAESDRRPEPSPLFWPRLADRIGEAVRREQAPLAPRGPWAWRLAPVGAIAVVVIAAAVGIRTWSRPSGGESGFPAAPRPAPAPVAADATADDSLGDDPSWALVSDLSEDSSGEDVGVLGEPPLPGEADRALLQLSDAERTELARILREELAPVKPAAGQGPDG